MSIDSELVQALIDGAPATLGVYAATIVLEPREYLFDEPVLVDKPVRIVGNNTRIRLTESNIAAFVVTTGGARFDTIWFRGWDNGLNITEQGGIALDIRGSRATVDDCIFEYLRVGVFLHSTSEDGLTAVGNANRFIVRACQFYWCINGLWTKGGDAQGGSISDCMFIDCRKGVVEGSFLGNHYAANLVEACPSPGDGPGYGISVIEPANYSTFTANYIESDSLATIGSYCLVVGGNLAGRPLACEKIGYWGGKLVFRGGTSNPDDLLFLGGSQGVGGIGWFQRGVDVGTYTTLKWTGTAFEFVPY